MKPKFEYPNHQAVRREANEILSMNANRLKLIEALCLCMLLIPLYHALQTIFAALAYEFVVVPSPVWMWTEKATVFFVTLLITVPMLLGVFTMAERMERGEESALIDLFYSFSSWSRYVKSVWVAWRIMWLPALVYFLLWGGIELCEALIVNEKDLRMSTGFLWIFAIIIGLFGIFCRFGVIALEMRSKTCPQTVAKFARFSCGRRYRSFDKFLGRYLWRILLGCLSVGILLLMDVIPQMLIAYFRYCRYLNDNDVTSEE